MLSSVLYGIDICLPHISLNLILLRSQRSHSEHACLHPPTREPCRWLSFRSLLSSPPSCSSGPPLHYIQDKNHPHALNLRQNIQHRFKINIPTLCSRYFSTINQDICFSKSRTKVKKTDLQNSIQNRKRVIKMSMTAVPTLNST